MAAGAGRPLRRRPGARLRPCHSAPSSTAWSQRAAAPTERSAWSATCATRPPSTAPWPRPTTGSAGSTPPSPPRGASPAATRPGRPTSDIWTTMIGRQPRRRAPPRPGGGPGPARATDPHGRRFVAVSSMGGAVGLPLLAAYVGRQARRNGLVRSLAAELGPLGITANAVAPGSTVTAMLAASAVVYEPARRRGPHRSATCSGERSSPTRSPRSSPGCAAPPAAA